MPNDRLVDAYRLQTLSKSPSGSKLSAPIDAIAE